ncbi:MAG: HemK2/MTQ2 family protein methyltransferase [Haloarculaceae archaeon]
MTDRDDDSRPGLTDDDDDSVPNLAAQRDVETVYQPAEDSRLLAETASESVERGDRALDVGTGSGYVAAELESAGARALGSDLSPLACEQAEAAGVPVVRANLLDPFADGAFDVVAFNPPYLPTPSENEWDDWMEQALSGGEDGRRLVDPFLDDVGRVLAPDGEAFLLISSLTGIEAVREYARERGLASEEVASEKHPYERLVVLRLARADPSPSDG